MSAASKKTQLSSGKNKERSSWRQVPAGIRVGGAFVTLGVVLLVFAAISLFQTGLLQGFEVTSGFILILIAAAILGAFATTSKYEASSRTQVISLTCAVALVILSRFLPSNPLAVIEQFWLSAWAVTAIVCGLIIRRAMLPK